MGYVRRARTGEGGGASADAGAEVQKQGWRRIVLSEIGSLRVIYAERIREFHDLHRNRVLGPARVSNKS